MSLFWELMNSMLKKKWKKMKYQTTNNQGKNKKKWKETMVRMINKRKLKINKS